MNLELDETQVTALRETLESTLSDLSYEISNTDQQDFRDGLKARRDALRRVQDALNAGR